MKIIFINNLYSPYSVGGAEKVIKFKAIDLVSSGENKEAIIITWRPWQGWGSWRPQIGVENDVIIYRFWVPNIFSYKNLNKHNLLIKLLWHKLDLFNFWSGRIVKKILQKENPDRVETHNLMGMGFSLPKVIQKLGFKHIHVLHDIQLVEPSGVLMWNHEKDNLLQKIYSWLMKKRMGKPNIIITHSEFLSNFYQTRNFFLNSEWQVEKNKQEKNKLKILSTNPRFLFVGSLVEHKGIKILMDAWNKLNNSEIELHIVGNGILLSEVKKWAENKENVYVYSRLEGEKLKEIYHKCDILIFPSLCIENRPVVILEALKYGLRIIASNTGGVPEFIKEKENAWLFRPSDVEFLVKRIKRFV